MYACPTRAHAQTLAAAGRGRFTLASARRALPLVRRVVEDVVALHARVLDVQEMVESAEAAGAPVQWQRAHHELVAVVTKLRDCLDELEMIGAELKDFASGQVDFPATVAGRAVRLCWRLGEPDILFWHAPDETARQPIETLPQQPLRTQRRTPAGMLFS